MYLSIYINLWTEQMLVQEVIYGVEVKNRKNRKAEKIKVIVVKVGDIYFFIVCLFVCMCVCVCVCTHARARARVCVCVFSFLILYVGTDFFFLPWPLTTKQRRTSRKWDRQSNEYITFYLKQSRIHFLTFHFFFPFPLLPPTPPHTLSPLLFSFFKPHWEILLKAATAAAKAKAKCLVAADILLIAFYPFFSFVICFFMLIFFSFGWMGVGENVFNLHWFMFLKFQIREKNSHFYFNPKLDINGWKL